jgi:hypothetical protein
MSRASVIGMYGMVWYLLVDATISRRRIIASSMAGSIAKVTVSRSPSVNTDTIDVLFAFAATIDSLLSFFFPRSLLI